MWGRRQLPPLGSSSCRHWGVLVVAQQTNRSRTLARHEPGTRWYSFVAWLLLYGNVLNVVNDLLDNLFMANFLAKALTLGLVALSPVLVNEVLRHMPRAAWGGEEEEL